MADRRKIRVFLASSAALEEERTGFADDLAAVQRREEVARLYTLEPIRWEDKAFGGSPGDINEAIRRSVDWESVDLVVVVVGSKVGEGTLDEYRRARDLWRVHGRPQILFYLRKPAEDASPIESRDEGAPPEDLVEGAAAVRALRRDAIADGIVPREYSDPGEFSELLRRHLPRMLAERRPEIDAETLRRARRRFSLSALATVALGALVWYVARVMGFPYDGVTRWRVDLILWGLPVLFVGFSLSVLAYHRLLSLLGALWRSPSWTNRALYESFDLLVPSLALPRAVGEKAPGRSSDWVTILLLILFLGVPAVGMSQCLFHELLNWEFVVLAHETDPADPSASRYVTGIGAGFRLADPEVRRLHEEQGDIIFVHAKGAFADEQAEPAKRNKGPEVYLPQQPLIYLGLVILTYAAILATIGRLVLYRRELGAS